jgi:hypothetical protein
MENQNQHIIINETKNTYIKADDNIIINEACIRWVKKISECLEVCSKITGCAKNDTHTICKLNNQNSYNKLNKYFD